MRPGRAPLLFVSLAITLSACRGCAGDEEVAFCVAIDRKDVAAAKSLFESGRLNMLARNGTGKCQPIMKLFDAARPKDKEITAMAVAFAKRPGMANTCWTAPGGSSGKGSTGGAQVCPIQSAVQNENLDVVRALLESGVALDDHVAQDAMITATNSLPMIQLLVEGGANPSYSMGAAVAYRRLDVLAYLESKGGREKADEILIAARRGDTAAIDAAITRRANLNVTDGGGHTAMMRAAMYGHAPIITRLARAGAGLETMVDGETAMHMAAREDQAAAIKALAAAKANVNARSEQGSPSPLVVAVNQGARHAVTALVDAGADPNVDADVDTRVMGKAIQSGNLAIVRELIRGGARVNEKHGAAWRPPLHDAVTSCGLPPEGEGENDYYRVNLMKALVSAGADSQAKNAKGQTPAEAVAAEIPNTGTNEYGVWKRGCLQAKLDYLKSLR